MKGGCDGCATAEAAIVGAGFVVETTAAAPANGAEEETTTGVEVSGCCGGG